MSEERAAQHAKCASLLISVGGEDSDRTMEEFLAAVETALKTQAGVKRVTVMRPYYILQGKVCLPQDYDPTTKDFRPGAEPPDWAGGRTESQKRYEEKFGNGGAGVGVSEEPEPVRTRKVRSDKGKPRKKATPAQVEEAGAELATAMKGTANG